MSTLTVAAVQCSQFWEDVEQNINKYDVLLDGVKADIVVLPEMFQTSFTMNAKVAEEWSNSRSISWLLEKSKQMQSAIYTSLMIREGHRVHNRGVFVEPSGDIATYDKRKCFGLAGEDEVITPGSKSTIVNYKGWNLQLQICYDLRFPEIMRNNMSKDGSPNYDALLFVANWPAKRVKHWSSLLLARAIENQCYLIGVNRVGKDANGHLYNGQSAGINAQGELLSTLSDEERVIYFELKKEKLKITREKLPFLKDQD